MTIKLLLAIALIALVGCKDVVNSHPMIGKKVEFSERNEVFGCTQRHQAEELMQMVSKVNSIKDMQASMRELGPVIEYCEQIEKVGQGRKVEWGTVAVVTDAHSTKDGGLLLKLDNGLWVPQWTDSRKLRVID